ncbi:hypothetical protein [Sphaerotilus mobilis]|uniref:Glycosyltransferase involved in cell wall biosynthesis n=1 Tax=Sphaerotilus mobilis TaxID=47994 RepID=A0A4Q7LBM1_9BURK|nr:hypothetical protein [Sphaerotilus mobilis]RZS47545.1 hypothetical protein EV685_3755 [Sphaerotilus mobilis]
MTHTAWWPHTTQDRIASYRLRCRQVIESLTSRGLDVGLFDSKASPPACLVLSKRYDARSLATACDLRQRAGTRLVLDLCDNHFWFSDDPTGHLARRRDDLVQACNAVDLVIAASESLGDVVRAETSARDIVVVPDAAESPSAPHWSVRWRHPKEQWQMIRLRRWMSRTGIDRARRLVWFGNQGSSGVEGGMGDLSSIASALKSAHARKPLSLTVISNSASRHAEVTAGWPLPTFYLPWSSRTFSEALSLHSAAVIPIQRNPFTTCKTANRLLSASLHGLNTLADNIPSYTPFRACSVLDDWDFALGGYLDQAERRSLDVQHARALAMNDYSIEQIADRWRQALELTP